MRHHHHVRSSILVSTATIAALVLAATLGASTSVAMVDVETRIDDRTWW